jgi:hypothetical protein
MAGIGVNMFMKKPTYKRFEYLPRYYDPSKDESERQRRRIRIQRNVRRGSHRPFLIIVLMFILVYLLYSIVS